MRGISDFAGAGYCPASMSTGSKGGAEAEVAPTVEGAMLKKRYASGVQLELGLTLGSGGRSRVAPPIMPEGSRRILKTKDFSSVGSRASPPSFNSSVSSSSSGLGSEERSGGGDGGAINRRACSNEARSENSPSHSQVVGWPPIRTCRRNNLLNLSRGTYSDIKGATHDEISQSCSSNATKKGIGSNDGETKSTHVGKTHFVKVNMDGDPIGRKVDLCTNASYETLALALEAMFHKPTLLVNPSTNGMVSKLFDDASGFVLTYEDEDGDWMLVGDVPWRMFLHTARRLRIMKTTDASGLGSGPRVWFGLLDVLDRILLRLKIIVRSRFHTVSRLHNSNPNIHWWKPHASKHLGFRKANVWL